MTAPAPTELLKQPQYIIEGIILRRRVKCGHGQNAAHHKFEVQSGEAPEGATHMRRPEYVTAWFYDVTQRWPSWLVDKYTNTEPVSERMIGRYAVAIDGEFWRWFDADKFNEMFVSIPAVAQASPSRDAIARIINGVAFRPAYVSGEGLTETQKEKYLRARNVAYYQADCILAEMDKASSSASAAEALPDLLATTLSYSGKDITIACNTFEVRDAVYDWLMSWASQVPSAPAQASWTILDDCKSLLAAIDHTLCVHGHIDAHTPLHERLQRTLSSVPSAHRKAGDDLANHITETAK